MEAQEVISDIDTVPDTLNNSEPSLADQLVSAREETAQYRDKFLRKAAEMDNQHKRHKKELEDLRRQNLESILKKMLPVFDNVERAVESIGAGSTSVESMADGIKILSTQFINTLTKLNVKRISTIGQQFNPAVHEAVQMVASDQPSGTVTSELQSGWTIGDFVLRAALVVVAL